ncbi:hypothetical protein KORDIASMS9_02242 [Kordia sp. SMS9]|uniref:hypothetical protein n=1 Tax=Kordia sp. SMS9 TaxID=2282170 RepID=UPI000E0D4B11|nr:hypothetical protein [Kordia sp. SMS9]AXG70013.1 hypothetical protein KORDIASMS9_02242 [Kordia sp. SMS9]
MKKNFKKYLALCTLILVTILACQKEEQIPQDAVTATTTQKAENADSERIERALREYKGREVEGNFIGRVIDEDNQPIIGATVTLGGQQEVTDANGIVSFINVIVNQNFAYAQASAQGYSNGSRVMVPTGSNSFTIKLFSLGNAQVITSDGGEISINSEEIGETYIRFNGGFMDENGNPYNGNVYVTANYLDPLSEDTANTMPGELYGIDANYQEVALGSYGMISVEMRGSAGEKLQITNPAQIEIPIHPSQMGAAPGSIPTWSFDENSGVWVEEGVAINNGTHFVAQVTHFSFWNCDAPFPVVNFDATVVQSGTTTPLSGMTVTISYSTFSRSAVTNASGVVSGKIPSGQVLTITVTDPCGTVVSTGTYGPYTGATSLTLPATLSTVPVNVSGTVVNCSGALVTNGYVIYKDTGGQTLGFATVTTGTHSYTAVACSIPITIVMDGLDNATGQTIVTTAAIANPTATANLVACGGTPTEFIRFSVNAGPLQYNIINPGGGVQTPSFINLGAQSPTSGTYIFGNTITPGTYPFDTNMAGPPALAMEVLGDVNGIDPVATVGIPGAIQFTILNVGGVGAFMEIEFTGNYIDRFGTTRTITGEAYIIRDY